MDKYGLSNLVVHAPYIINIANTKTGSLSIRGRFPSK